MSQEKEYAFSDEEVRDELEGIGLSPEQIQHILEHRRQEIDSFMAIHFQFGHGHEAFKDALLASFG